ncbi:MAG: bacteriophage holin [Candidatus Micrarchaeota archaeon]
MPKSLMLDAKAVGISCGLMWGAAQFLMGLLATYTGYGLVFVNFMASIYPGDGLGLMGSTIGGVMGFVDGFLGGYIFVWLYNRLAK